MSRELELGALVGGRYQVTGVLGEGAFGCVYRAEQLDLARPVALKVLRREWMDDPVVVAGFGLEARMAARTSHPNIVEVYEVGETADGRRFIAMEIARGHSVRELLGRGGPLACARATDLLDQTLRGLAAAHAHGVVHADLKPDNLILTPVGDRELVKIIDFGIASPRGCVSGSAHTLCGTPAYMAPELAGGAPPAVASDLYAAGVIFYELLTGEVPFHGDSATEILSRHVRDPLVVPDRLRDRVSPDHEAFLRRALAKQPADRFGTAEHMRAALEVATGETAEMPQMPAARTPSTRARGCRQRVTMPAIMTPTSRECADVSRRVDFLHRRIAGAIRGGAVETLVRCYAELSDLLVSAGETGRAAAELAEGVSMVASAESRGDPSPLLVRLAELARLAGEFDRAVAHAREAYRRAGLAGRLLTRNRARALLNQLVR